MIVVLKTTHILLLTISKTRRGCKWTGTLSNPTHRHKQWNNSFIAVLH